MSPAGYNVMSHRTQLYQPLMYLFCLLIRSGLRSNFAFAKQSKLRSGILKWNKKSTSSVFHFIWLCFYFKMSHNIYHISSWATIPEYLPRGDTKALARYVTQSWRQASGDITLQDFCVTSSGLIFWNVNLKAMWYMYMYNI